MKDQTKTHMYKIGNALLHTPGDTNPVQRGLIIDYVVSKTLSLGENPNSFRFLDRNVLSLVDKVTFAAYSIEDEDMALLRESGWSDDAIYEIVLTAAYAAGLARMQMLYSLLNDSRK